MNNVILEQSINFFNNIPLPYNINIKCVSTKEQYFFGKNWITYAMTNRLDTDFVSCAQYDDGYAAVTTNGNVILSELDLISIYFTSSSSVALPNGVTISLLIN